MAFIHGFFLALGLILPLGVQNVFIFNQGASQPRLLRAVPAVITATMCDMILILLAVLGVSVMVLSINWVKIVFVLVGILFLIYMGYITWKSTFAASNPQPESESEGAAAAETPEEPKAISPKKQIAFAASVSLLNPHAILDTVGVIGTSSLQYAGSDKVWFTMSTILVSFVWFVFLAVMGRVIRGIKPSFTIYINRFSAIIMWVSASYLAASLILS